jgi:hypothetical protein
MLRAFIVLAVLGPGLVACSPDTPAPLEGLLRHDATPLDYVGYQEFVPPAGQGRVVIVLSGHGGTSAYTSSAREFASLGYYAVLFDGQRLPAVGCQRWQIPAPNDC